MTEALKVKADRPRVSSPSSWPSPTQRDFRDDGATSLESWTAMSFGVSVATARSFCQVAEKTHELPHLTGSLCAGEISFDEVRAVVHVATPETDRELCKQAKEHSVRDLAEVARTTAARTSPPLLRRHAPSTTAAPCASTVRTAPCRSSSPKTPPPRPRPVSMPLPPRSPPRKGDTIRPAPLRRFCDVDLAGPGNVDHAVTSQFTTPSTPSPARPPPWQPRPGRSSSWPMCPSTPGRSRRRCE